MEPKEMQALIDAQAQTIKDLQSQLDTARAVNANLASQKADLAAQRDTAQATLAEKVAVVAEKDALAKTKEEETTAVLAEKDATITAKELEKATIVAEKDATITEKETERVRLAALVGEFDPQIQVKAEAEKQAKIERLAKELAELQGGRVDG